MVRARAAASVAALFVLGVGSAATARPLSFFDVFTELPVVGPDSPPITVGVFDEVSPGGVTNTHNQDLRLNGLPPGVPVKGTMSMIGHDNGGPPGSPGIDSFFDIFYGDLMQPPPPPSSFFDVFVELQTVPGMPPPMLLSPPVLQRSVDSFFDVFYEVELPGLGVHTTHLHVEAPANGRFGVVDLQPQMLGSFFDVFVELQLVGPGSPGQQMAHITMNGSFVPATGTIALAGLAVAPLVRRRRR